MATRTAVRLEEKTKEELYDLAQEAEIEGRSEMNKDELVEALESESKGPNAVDLILEQHETIRELFTTFESLSDRPSKRKDDTVREIITVLSKHANVEEMLFYPTAMEVVPELQEHVEEDMEEHRLVELALLQLDHLSSESDRFDAKVRVVVENVREHLEEEEQELLPRIREEMDEDDLRQLGAAMLTAWETAPSRPHPMTPKSPVVKFLVGPAVAAYDWSVNTLRSLRKTISR